MTSTNFTMTLQTDLFKINFRFSQTNKNALVLTCLTVFINFCTKSFYKIPELFPYKSQVGKFDLAKKIKVRYVLRSVNRQWIYNSRFALAKNPLHDWYIDISGNKSL